MLKQKRKNSVVVLLTLSWLLASCGTPSQPSMPVNQPEIPAPPVQLMEPPKRESYLDRALMNIEQWRQTLTH